MRSSSSLIQLIFLSFHIFFLAYSRMSFIFPANCSMRQDKTRQEPRKNKIIIPCSPLCVRLNTMFHSRICLVLVTWKIRVEEVVFAKREETLFTYDLLETVANFVLRILGPSLSSAILLLGVSPVFLCCLREIKIYQQLDTSLRNSCHILITFF